MVRLIPGLMIALAWAAAAVTMPARAADVALPGYHPPQGAYLPPALYDWTGVYFGGHVGAGLLHDSVTWNTNTTTTMMDLTDPLKPISTMSMLHNAGTSTEVRPAGVIGGAQLGANYEFAPWVVGIEGSFTSSAISGSTKVNALETGANHTVTVEERSNSNPQWLATATGRVGYAANTLLMYLKGGVAWMHAEYTQDVLATSRVFVTAKLNDTRTGFVAGAGLEYGMTENLSAKAEYDFYDFGTANYSFNVADPPGMPVSIKSQIHTLTVGLNYRWNWDGRWR